MKYDKVEGELYDKVCDLNLAITDFIMQNRDEENNGVKKGMKHLYKVQEIFDEITENNEMLAPMYGPPEDFFSKKDKAEEKLREETMLKIINKKLLATQWKEIVKQILNEVPESREIIERLISE